MFHPLGFALEVATNSAAVEEAARLSWGRFSPVFQQPPIRLRVIVEEGGSAEMPAPPAYRAQAAVIAIVADAWNFAVCDCDGNHAFAFVTPAVAANAAYFCYYFLEGIAFNTRWLFSPVEIFLGRKVESINIVGGGAQSDVWCQIFADVMDVEIKQVADPIYANARGAAWIGAVGLGEIKFSDVPKLVQFKRTYRPQQQNRAIYDNRFEIFKHIYKQTKDIYHRLNG